jgi:hypothetical protein
MTARAPAAIDWILAHRYALLFYAALSACLLAGFGFAVVYWSLEARRSTSASSRSRRSASDVVPAHLATRGLAIVEAVAGPLYVAVLVAALLGMRFEPR